MKLELIKRKVVAALRGFGGMLALCLCLFACTHQVESSTRASLISSLEKRGVAVTTVGETVTILLPSDLLFIQNSANIREDYASVLTQVAQLLHTYILVSVKVKAYSDAIEPLALQALTTKQAQVVSNALWDYGIDTRLISAEGGGSTDLVVKGGNYSQRAANRRIEINFRYYPPVSYYD